MSYREEWLGNFRFVEYEEFKLERPSVLFVALPDTGLVGVISASYMTSKLGGSALCGHCLIFVPLHPARVFIGLGGVRGHPRDPTS
jgi:proteasome assembly chaperone (PAC2) family protein